MDSKTLRIGALLTAFSLAGFGIYYHQGYKVEKYFDWEGYEQMPTTHARLTVLSSKASETFFVKNAADCLRQAEHRAKEKGLASFIECYEDYDNNKLILKSHVDTAAGVANEYLSDGTLCHDRVRGPKALPPKVVPVGFLNKL